MFVKILSVPLVYPSIPFAPPGYLIAFCSRAIHPECLVLCVYKSTFCYVFYLSLEHHTLVSNHSWPIFKSGHFFSKQLQVIQDPANPVGECFSISPTIHTLVVVISPFLNPNHQAIQDPALTLTQRHLHMAGQKWAFWSRHIEASMLRW